MRDDGVREGRNVGGRERSRGGLGTPDVNHRDSSSADGLETSCLYFSISGEITG